MYNCLSRGRNLTLHIKSINPQSYPCQGSKMEKITYKQAAELLGCEYMTIRYAVMENRLTRCVSKNRDALLLKDQVQLFVDKPRISIKYLALEEKTLFEEYKKIAESPELVANTGMTQEQVIDAMIRNAVEEGRKAGREEAFESLLRWLNAKFNDSTKDLMTNPQMPQVPSINS